MFFYPISRAFTILGMLAALLLSGCGAVVTGIFQPVGIPVEFSLNTRGEWKISTSRSWSTPIGRFTIEVGAEDRLPSVPDNWVRVTIAADPAGRVRDVFMMKAANDIHVWSNGPSHVAINYPNVDITPLAGTDRIVVNDVNEVPPDMEPATLEPLANMDAVDPPEPAAPPAEPEPEEEESSWDDGSSTNVYPVGVEVLDDDWIQVTWNELTVPDLGYYEVTVNAVSPIEWTLTYQPTSNSITLQPVQDLNQDLAERGSSEQVAPGQTWYVCVGGMAGEPDGEYIDESDDCSDYFTLG